MTRGLHSAFLVLQKHLRAALSLVAQVRPAGARKKSVFLTACQNNLLTACKWEQKSEPVGAELIVIPRSFRLVLAYQCDSLSSHHYRKCRCCAALSIFRVCAQTLALNNSQPSFAALNATMHSPSMQTIRAFQTQMVGANTYLSTLYLERCVVQQQEVAEK